MNWIEILKAAGINAGIYTGLTIPLLIVIGYFSKKLFDYFLGESTKVKYQKDLEDHKQKLNAESEIHRLKLSKSLEEYRSQLEAIRTEIQIITSQLHTERLQIIKELYSMLVFFENRVSMLVISGSGREENEVKEINKLYYDIKIKFWTNRIFFNEKTSELLENLIGKIRSALFKI